MAVVTVPSSVSPADALWVLYQSQTKKVKKAFLQRIAEEEAAARESKEMNAYEQSLTEAQRTAAHEFVDIVKARANEVVQASKEGHHVGRSANDFLQELQAE